MRDPQLTVAEPRPTASEGKRKRGGQPNNRNALRHGRYSVRLKAERWAAGQAERDEARRREMEWFASCPKVDYASRIDELIRLRQQQEAEEARRVAHLRLCR